MISQIIEVTQGREFNWGKFLVQQFGPEEWQRRSALPGNDLALPLIFQRGWTPKHILVTDLETGEGALFRKDDPFPIFALRDKHQIWVCPMFEPFLVWLCKQEYAAVTELPPFVQLETDVETMVGLRAGGRDAATEELWRAIDAIAAAAVEHGVPDAVMAKIAVLDRDLRTKHGRSS